MNELIAFYRIGAAAFALVFLGNTEAGREGMEPRQGGLSEGPGAKGPSFFLELESGEDVSSLLADPGECAIEDAYFQSAQGGCQELSTSLVWVPGELYSQWTWVQAMSIAANLESGGYSDWRLPTVAELQHMASSGNYLHLPIDGSSSYGYWSSETKGKNAWGVILGGSRNGETSLASKQGYRFVLCVRQGTL